ncbi:DUF4174 domain-containing protein [uncultured Kordia sp.]|uniref:DUF4174 domain-containing protein n=1 Tax=uncultured Kordia sp. TaxID=507699 RepID=UPI00262FB4A8|nr:DUF4174 domain-containing protein [uncultured Kordia sp.]
MKSRILNNRIIFIIIMSLSFAKLSAQDLKQHQWEHRILIVKTTYPESKQFQAQLTHIKNAASEMIARKFVVYTIIQEDFTFINYKDVTLNNVGKLHGKLSKVVNDKKEFEVILIGLDGGVKLQQTNVLTTTKLFNKVDSMPMRRSEMRKKQKK